MEREHVIVCRLGRVRYAPVWELQRQIQQRLIAAKRASPPEAVPHVMLLLEHDPVFTLGKSGSDANLLWSREQLEIEGVEFHYIDRGGDITFHGPGQLVGYPILDLDRFFTDIHRYLRELEESVIAVLDHWGIPGDRVNGRTGVWIGPDARGAERKVCAMGVRCSRWVTMHGFALNVDPQMHYFEGIIPCGIDDRGVTSMAGECGRPVPMEAVMDQFEAAFRGRLSCRVTSLSGSIAWEFLQEFLESSLSPSRFISLSE